MAPNYDVGRLSPAWAFGGHCAGSILKTPLSGKRNRTFQSLRLNRCLVAGLKQMVATPWLKLQPSAKGHSQF